MLNQGDTVMFAHLHPPANNSAKYQLIAHNGFQDIVCRRFSI